MIDLRGLQRAGAIAASALQIWYATFAGPVGRQLRVPRLDRADLDFLGDKTRLYRLGVVLASAELFRYPYVGRCIVRDRDRNLGTIVIADSGGFSRIAEKCLPDPRWVRANQLGQERFADVAIAPDAPTLAADLKINKDLDTFDKCLSNTRLWLEDYVERRQRRGKGPPIVLNVLQGRSPEEWDRWIDQARQFQSEFQGWAFAGGMRQEWAFLLERIAEMLARGELDRCPWLHWLGVGNVGAAIVLTAIRDGIREATGNHALEVSFDDAQGNIGPAKGWSVPILPDLGPRRAIIRSAKLPNDVRHIGSEELFTLGSSPLTEGGMTLGHVCVRRGSSTRDLQANCLLANHVMFVRVKAMAEAAAHSTLPVLDAARCIPYRFAWLRERIIEFLRTGQMAKLDLCREQLANLDKDSILL